MTGGIYLALEAAGNPAAAPTNITSANLIPATTTAGADDERPHQECRRVIGVVDPDEVVRAS